MTNAWPIEWFVCKADTDDVRFAKTEERKTIRVGSEMWRVPYSIGPISIDHNHWARHHLALTNRQAIIISNLPIYLANMRKLKTVFNMFKSGGLSPKEMEKLIPSLPRVGWENKGE